MPEGTPVFMRTEFAHGKLADLEMTFVHVVDDYLAPMPVYMLEASDPVLIQLGRRCCGDERFAHFYGAGHLGCHCLWI